MFLDDVAVVFVNRKAGRQAGLGVAAHAEAIEIHTGFLLQREGALTECLEIARGPLVDLGGVGIGGRRQLELGPRDTQKAEWVAVGQRARFVGIDDIVRNSCDAGSGLWFRAQRTEGLERRHETRNYTIGFAERAAFLRLRMLLPEA